MEHDLQAQRNAEAHLEECWETSEDDDSGFCGCTTCIVREVLEAAAPELYAGFVDLVESYGVKIPAQVANLFAEEPK